MRGWDFFRVLGVMLVTGGLIGLGWIGWQFWGTDWQSARIQEQVRTETQEAWAAHREPKETEWGSVQALVKIPRFGDDYVIPLLEFTGYKALHAGFGHMPESAQVGKQGNYVIIAHRTTRNEPLRNMPELEPGDTVVIETRTKTYTYRLTTGGDDLRIPFTQGWVLDELPDNPVDGGPEPAQKPGQRLITLITCAELFHSDFRLAAFGELVSIEQKP